ncbi:MAG: hypothetical protein QNJ97_10325 [Myxococcota bacterium]|nr:hypothetical protein [Myxococcota bacterium]
MRRFVLTIALTCIVLISSNQSLRADRSSAPFIVPPGKFQALAAAGPLIIDRSVYLGLEGSFEIGLFPGFELAGPLALTLRIIEPAPGSGVYLCGGIVDMWFRPKTDVFFAPAVILGGQARVGPAAAVRAAMDVTWVTHGVDDWQSDAWLRGSFAVVIDFGRFATVTAGVSYQRIISGQDQPSDQAYQTGWVGNSRVSVGSVRAAPFHDSPILSIHVARFLDVIVISRFDINMERNTNDIRLLAGIEVH